MHRRTRGLAKGNAGHFPQSTSAYYLKLLETAAPSLAFARGRVAPGYQHARAHLARKNNILAANRKTGWALSIHT